MTQIQKIKWTIMAGAIIGMCLGSACNSIASEQKQESGTLEITANGEDFVRNGFTTEDGYSINFTTVLVHINDPVVWQVPEEKSGRHPGHSHGSIPDDAPHYLLENDYWAELKVDDVASIAELDDAELGNYNRIGFSISQGSAGSVVIAPDNEEPEVDSLTGYSIVMRGQADKDDESLTFSLYFTEETDYTNCGPNEENGVLEKDGHATAEMTFHFDHIFGDAEAGEANPTDSENINFGAVGFEPFAAAASGGTVDLTQTQMQNDFDGAVYVQLVNALQSIGHSGEAHCDY